MTPTDHRPPGSQDVAIALHGVSKGYPRFHRPIDRLKVLVAPRHGREDDFLALRDVTLEIPSGHTVGIVGRNGSGKSTLLQVVAGTLKPSAGEVSVRGRVSALLELGSGFIPELTGRENVEFLAALNDFEGERLARLIDEVLAFADIGSFIDQPVRTYSSGMFVRLAFALAVGVDPDILVVDEALSVGDEWFQRKCYGRIRSFQERGRTILFVSHSATTVVDLCDWAVLLDRGEVLLTGAPKVVVSRYHQLLFAAPAREEQVRAELRVLRERGTEPPDATAAEAQPPSSLEPTTAPVSPPPPQGHLDPELRAQHRVEYPSRGATISEVQLLTPWGGSINVVSRGALYVYTYRVAFDQPAFKVRFGMLLKTVSGYPLGGAVSHPPGDGVAFVEARQIATVRFTLRCLLAPGTYFLNAGVVAAIDGSEQYLHRLIDALAFRVLPDEDPLMTGTVDFLIEPAVEWSGAAHE